MEDICSICKEHKRARFNLKAGKLICHNCYTRDPSMHEKCSKCRKVKLVAMHTESGKAICHNCYRKDSSIYERCLRCGEVKQVVMRTKYGRPICLNCRQRSKVGKCAECGKKKVIQALGLCYGCYQYQRRARMAVSPA